MHVNTAYRMTHLYANRIYARDEDVFLRISFCKFKPKRVLARITESQLSWFGHACRMTNMHLPKRILMEMVPGTNRQGRPRKRWEDDIIAGSTFLEAYRNAEDRSIRGGYQIRRHPPLKILDAHPLWHHRRWAKQKISLLFYNWRSDFRIIKALRPSDLGLGLGWLGLARKGKARPTWGKMWSW